MLRMWETRPQCSGLPSSSENRMHIHPTPTLPGMQPLRIMASCLNIHFSLHSFSLASTSESTLSLLLLLHLIKPPSSCTLLHSRIMLIMNSKRATISALLLRLKSNQYWVLSGHHCFPSSPNWVESTNFVSYKTYHFHTLLPQLTT